MLRNILIWTLAIVLSATSSAAAIGAIAKNKVPSLALSIVPTNGLAAESAAEAIAVAIVAENQGEFPERVDQESMALALQAFRSEPITPGAIAVMAFACEEGDRRDLMEKAFDLSRRQRLVTGWMIQDSSLREDIPAILKYYDTLLRTSSSARPVVLPIIASTLTNENAIEPIAEMLSRSPPWGRDFWRTAGNMGEIAEGLATLRSRIHSLGISNTGKNDAKILGNLVEGGHFQKAFRLYDDLANNSQKPLNNFVRGGDFKSQPRLFPLEWRLYSSGEFGAEVEPELGRLWVSSLPKVNAIFATQIIHLAEGDYMLSASSKAQTSEAPNPLSLRLRCAENSHRKRDEVLKLTDGTARMKIEIANQDCSYFWLSLLGNAQDTNEGYDFTVTGISLVKS